VLNFWKQLPNGALHYRILSYKKIKKILDTGYDKINPGKNFNRELQPSLFHNNIRGDSYYGKSQQNEPKIDSQGSMSFSDLLQLIKERHEDGTN
jgi:hypothetical protein